MKTYEENQLECEGCGDPFTGDIDSRYCADCEELYDKYGNPKDGSRLINCCFPDCGCDGYRLCKAESGPSQCACWLNVERGTKW